MSNPNATDDDSGPGVGPIDYDVLDRLRSRLDGSDRFSSVEFRPDQAPDAVVVTYDLGYFPAVVEQASLRIRWFETDDFNVHYAEQYADGESWECRWDRHPNEHNTRDHFHPPPDAATPGEDEDFPHDWLAVLSLVITALDDRIASFWE